MKGWHRRRYAESMELVVVGAAESGGIALDTVSLATGMRETARSDAVSLVGDRSLKVYRRRFGAADLTTSVSSPAMRGMARGQTLVGQGRGRIVRPR